MKKYTLIFAFLLTIFPAIGQGAISYYGNWFPATKNNFPLKAEDGMEYRYAIGTRVNDKIYFLSAKHKDGVAVSDVSSIRGEYLQTNLDIVSSKDCYAKGEVKPMQIYASKKPDNPDEFYCEILALYEDESGNTTLKYVRKPGPKVITGALEWHNDYQQINLKWKDDHFQICADGLVLQYYWEQAIFVDPSSIYYRDGKDFTLFMNKNITPWNPGFRKELPADPRELEVKDGYLNEIDNTFYVLADDNPFTLYLGNDSKDRRVIEEQSRLSITPADNYTDLDYTIWPNLDMPCYEQLTITPSSSLAGKSYDFNFSREGYDVEWSSSEALSAENTTITFKFIPKNSVYWKFGQEEFHNNKATLCYSSNANEEKSFSHEFAEDIKPHIISVDREHNSGDDSFDADDNAIPGFAIADDGGYIFKHCDHWTFSSEDQEIVCNLPGGTPGNEALNLLGSYPDLELKVKPHKPELRLEENNIPHRRGEWDEAYRITIPREMFETGSDYEHYARILLIPQFQTFTDESAAADFYGTDPHDNISDSWLSSQWYEENGHSGFMPVMQWDDMNQEYYCEINPDNMSFEGWDGYISYDNKLVSGHYLAYLIPSEADDHRQYGIVQSDPVDLYIHPTLHDMKMHLYVRDDKGQEPYWSDYEIEYDDFFGDFSFSGPQGDDHGETAYAHARITPNSDFCEVWVETSRHRPAYPEGEIPGQSKPEKKTAKAATRNADEDPLDGYTKVEAEDYIDLSNKEAADENVNGSDSSVSATIKLVKNGAISPAQSFMVSKSGDTIITGLETVNSDTDASKPIFVTPTGVRVETPDIPGIYIEIKDSQTRKVAIR